MFPICIGYLIHTEKGFVELDEYFNYPIFVKEAKDSFAFSSFEEAWNYWKNFRDYSKSFSIHALEVTESGKIYEACFGSGGYSV